MKKSYIITFDVTVECATYEEAERVAKKINNGIVDRKGVTIIQVDTVDVNPTLRGIK